MRLGTACFSLGGRLGETKFQKRSRSCRAATPKSAAGWLSVPVELELILLAGAALDLPLNGFADERAPVLTWLAGGVDARERAGRERHQPLLRPFKLPTHAGRCGRCGESSQIAPISHIRY